MSFFFPFGMGPEDGEGLGGGAGGKRGKGGKAAKVDNETCYKLLGLTKEATAGDIKKAFRKMAMTHHPDKGGDPEKFKEISKAYEILSDPKKKELYDEGGMDAVDGASGGGGGGGGGGMDFFDMMGMGGGRRRGGGGERRGEDVVFPLKVSLEDLYNGITKKLRLTKSVICKDCGGKGGKGTGDMTCRDCRGQGIRVVVRQLGPGMIQQMQTQCDRCNGEGTVIPDKDRCKVCKGTKTVKEKKTLEVFVTKGMNHGTKIPFKGEGDEAPNTVPGDVIVVLQQTEHPVFRREGPNLFMKKPLTLLEALTGFSFHITHLDNRTLLVKSDENTVYTPGSVKAIRDEGMPLVKNPFVRGSIFVEFDVQFPKASDLRSKQQLKALLPNPAPTDTTDQKDAEEVTLVDVDLEAEKRTYAEQQKEAYEEDEEGRRGPRGAQCQAQ